MNCCARRPLLPAASLESKAVHNRCPMATGLKCGQILRDSILPTPLALRGSASDASREIGADAVTRIVRE
jgi:hypothetical protein